MERKLTTILFASVEGYQQLLDIDEDRAIGLVHEFKEIYVKFLENYRGRIVSKTAGEAMFEFQSPVNAAKFGILCQRMLFQRNVDCQTAHPLLVRMAINVGDVIFDGNDLMGSAINLASQVGRIADVGGIWVSGVVHNEIYNKVGECTFTDLGMRSMDMIRLPVRLYALELPGVSHAPARSGTAPKVPDSIDEALGEPRIDNSIETPIDTPIDAPIDAPVEEAQTNGALTSGSTAPAQSRQTGVQTPRTTREFIAVIMRDREAAAISVSSAHRILVSGNFELATRVFMARVVRKKDFSAMVELLGMARNKTIPTQFREASGAVFESFFESLLSHKNMALAGQIFSEGFFGAEKRKVAFTIWRIAARKDVGAMRLLGCAVLELPNPTEEQVTDALSLLEQAARRKDAKAAMRLGSFYANPLILSQHKTEAFQWYWLARHLKDPTAQSELENLAKSIRKDEFPSIKIVADALVEEVEWNSRYNF
jgi:class 3 adenylate cyclase